MNILIVGATRDQFMFLANAFYMVSEQIESILWDQELPEDHKMRTAINVIYGIRTDDNSVSESDISKMMQQSKRNVIAYIGPYRAIANIALLRDRGLDAKEITILRKKIQHIG